MAIGRPQKLRVRGSGEKLLTALRVAGLTWSSTTLYSPSHVCNNKRWKECGLPHSATTIANDIRLGSPFDRVDKYAAFFCVRTEVFLDSDILSESPVFHEMILASRHKIVAATPLPLYSENPALRQLLSRNNTHEDVARLYELLSGVFRFYVWEVSAASIFRGVIHICGIEENTLLLHCFISMHDVELSFWGRCFRLGAFLHVNYYCEDADLVGYVIGRDPLLSVIARRKAPLRLAFFGVAGSVASTTIPDRLSGYVEKVDTEQTQGDAQACHEALFDRLAAEIKARKSFTADDSDYGEVYERLMLLMQDPDRFNFL